MANTWYHGAYSRQPATLGGGFSFVLPSHSNGVAVGLSKPNLPNEPSSMLLGILSEDGKWCVIKDGVQITPWEYFVDEARFYLLGGPETFSVHIRYLGEDVAQPVHTATLETDDVALHLNSAFSNPWHIVLEARVESGPEVLGLPEPVDVYVRAPALFMSARGVGTNPASLYAEAPAFELLSFASTFEARAVVGYMYSRTPAFATYTPSRNWAKPYAPEFMLRAGTLRNLVEGYAPTVFGGGYGHQILGDIVGSITIAPMTAKIARDAQPWYLPHVSADGAYIRATAPELPIIGPVLPLETLRSVLIVSDRTETFAVYDPLISDNLYLRARVEGAPFPISSDALELSDLASGELPPAVISDTLNLSDALVSWVTAQPIKDSLSLSDRVTGTPFGEVSASLDLSDEAVYEAQADPINDILDLTDETTSWAIQKVEALKDSLRLSDATWAPDLSVALSRDVLWLADAPGTLTTTAEATAVVLAPATQALHTWKGWPFTHMAQTADGTVLAVGPTGLYVVGAGEDTDEGVPITSRVRFGALEFGGYTREGEPRPSALKHRVENLWVAMGNTGPLQTTMGVLGQPKRYTYVTQQSPNGDETNQRAVPGKGLAGRYWDIELTNRDGADFEVVDISADVVDTARRI